MRGLLLLLPVILVIIILAGSGQAEEEVARQQVEGLALEEKAEVALERDAREAAKKKGAEKGNGNNKKEKVKKRQRKVKRTKQRGDKKSKNSLKKKRKQGANKKGNKAGRKKKTSRNNPDKKKKKSVKKKQKRQKIQAGTKKKKGKAASSKKKGKGARSKKKGNGEKRKKKGSKRNGGKTKQKKKRNKKKTSRNKVKTTKRKRKGSKKQKSTINGRQGPPVWSDWSSCGKSGVNDSCILNAVSALNFEKNQIQTFLKQKARLLNQNKTTGKKLGKKGEFTDAAGYLLIALGGNISTPACGERESSNASKTLNTRGMNAAMDTYATLINCSATIKEGCSMPDQHINQTFLDDCEVVYKKSKDFSEDCRSNKAYTDDGSLACLCWEKAAWGIVVAKEKGCTTASTKSAKAVKKQKTSCLKAFSKCKKAEDAAIALVHTCMAGEINTVAAKGEGRF